jgi:hypothetical protein
MRYGSGRQFATFYKGSSRQLIPQKIRQITGFSCTSFLTAGQRCSRICEERRKALEFRLNRVQTGPPVHFSQHSNES